jgi:hypothetical protein
MGCEQEIDVEESGAFYGEFGVCGECWPVVSAMDGDQLEMLCGLIEAGGVETLLDLSGLWCECGSEYREATGQIIDGVATCWRCLPENEGWEDEL